MKNRKYSLVLAVIVYASLLVNAGAGRQDEITLLMVPRNEETVKVGVDIANKYPTLLISYKVGANQAISLHGWTGIEWVNITLNAFQKGDFFNQGPNSALIIEQSGSPVPPVVIPPVDWCADVSKITTTEVRPLLHLLGQYYDFRFKDWEWFAKRYGQELDAINPEGLNVAWYHRPMSEHVIPSDRPGASDLQYWISIRRPEVIAEPEASSADTNAVGEEVEGNPLTNDAPAAVIMGVDDAVEENAESTEAAAPAPAAEEEVVPVPEESAEEAAGSSDASDAVSQESPEGAPSSEKEE